MHFFDECAYNPLGLAKLLVSEQYRFPPQRANRSARFAPGRGDLFMVNLHGLGLSSRKVKTNTGKEVTVEIEFYFRLHRKPKTKKVTVIVEENGNR